MPAPEPGEVNLADRALRYVRFPIAPRDARERADCGTAAACNGVHRQCTSALTQLLPKAETRISKGRHPVIAVLDPEWP